MFMVLDKRVGIGCAVFLDEDPRHDPKFPSDGVSVIENVTVNEWDEAEPVAVYVSTDDSPAFRVLPDGGRCPDGYKPYTIIPPNGGNPVTVTSARRRDCWAHYVQMSGAK